MRFWLNALQSATATNDKNMEQIYELNKKFNDSVVDCSYGTSFAFV